MDQLHTAPRFRSVVVTRYRETRSPIIDSNSVCSVGMVSLVKLAWLQSLPMINLALLLWKRARKNHKKWRLD